MSLALLIALQAVAPPAAGRKPVDIRTIDFDLSRYRPGPLGCAPAPGDILVCGRRPAGTVSAAEMARLATLYEQGPIDAETGLFGQVRGRIYTEQAAMPNGQTSKRAMVGIRLPF
ncbi:MAG: hypothetical protein QOG84_1788 [Sphingomonadales bacterium]|jgi:hypothetical protein|nr:hypothetical protein [Sphingomonadales bacterium]